jgi:S1-C subfamily serine protease
MVFGLVTAYSQLPQTTPPARGPRAGQLGGSGIGGAVPVQVVSVVRRLSGPRVLSLLRRNGTPIEPADEELLFERTATTNITAGLVLGDGQTVAVFLPKAEAELYSWSAFPDVTFPSIPAAKFAATLPPPQPGPQPEPGPGLVPAPKAAVLGVPPAPFSRDGDLTVMAKSGLRLSARYGGVDGGTGLSFIRVTGVPSQAVRDADEGALVEGQSLRVLSPAPSPAGARGQGENGTLLVQISEVSARLSGLIRSPNGRLSAMTITSPLLSAGSIGGVVVNDQGQTVGLVEKTGETSAAVIPVGVVRSAAARTLARTPAAPRPWLGVRGEALWSLKNTKLEEFGWSTSGVYTLTSQPRGILLTSVIPGTPAADAKLLPGDVILSVNGEEIRSNEDLSAMLSKSKVNTLISLNLMRPNEARSFAVLLKPTQVVDPVGATIFAEQRAAFDVDGTGFNRLGIETLVISEHLASRLGAKGGLFVLNVQPGGQAYKSGLLGEDVIESVNGEPAGMAGAMTLRRGTEITLTVVRRMNRFNLVVPVN